MLVTGQLLCRVFFGPPSGSIGPPQKSRIIGPRRGPNSEHRFLPHVWDNLTISIIADLEGVCIGNSGMPLPCCCEAFRIIPGHSDFNAVSFWAIPTQFRNHFGIEENSLIPSQKHPRIILQNPFRLQFRFIWPIPTSIPSIPFHSDPFRLQKS